MAVMIAEHFGEDMQVYVALASVHAFTSCDTMFHRFLAKEKVCTGACGQWWKKSAAHAAVGEISDHVC